MKLVTFWTYLLQHTRRYLLLLVHLVSFVESFHRAHLVSEMRSQNWSPRHSPESGF